MTLTRLSIVLLAAASVVAAQSVQITSPADGARVNAGQIVSVEVKVEGTFRAIMILGADGIGPTSTLAAPPYRFAVPIPATVSPGVHLLTAAGFPAAGEMARSLPVKIDVERSDAPIRLQVQPSALSFVGVGKKGWIHVNGIFADGSSADLTHSTLTVYHSGGTVSAGIDGVVTSERRGQDTLTVTYGNLSASVPVEVDLAFNILPPKIAMYPGQKEKFTAQTLGLAKPTVVWSIDPALGRIDDTGVYTAPETIETKQAVTVTVANEADRTQRASAMVTLNPPIAVHVIPTIASLGPSETQIFGARVENATWPDVIWNLPKGSPGTLDEWGHYTAPKSIVGVQTITIQAISAMDGKTVGSAIVTLRPPIYKLTTSVSPAGAGTITPESGSFYTTGTVVTLSARPNAGYSFRGWSGSPDVVDPSANPDGIAMKSAEAVIAHFTALSTAFKASGPKKSGPVDARVWKFELHNSGPGAANAAQLSRLEFQQTQGEPCSPRIQSQFPMALGNLAPRSSLTVPLTVNFSGCTNARFVMNAFFTANDGATTLHFLQQKQDP